MSYQPPFEITSPMIHRISSIAEQIGRQSGQQLQLSPQLRKQNRIQTIHSTLAIEGNTLSLEQVTAILDGKRVLGKAREISEVQGAIQAYEALPQWNPFAAKDLLAAHKLLMGDILKDAGKFRKGGVGIHKGEQVVHVAPPPAKRVPGLITDLMSWAKTTDSHALITSCVFHYELEFIHPFMDGNGRMGRLWQTLMLGQWNELFYLLPIEQIETSTDQASDQVTEQVQRLLAVMDDDYLTAQELMAQLSLSHRPTFRKNYLNPALKAGLVMMQYPNKPRSPKQKYRKAVR